jgi:phospholipid/cholesterol/gamma-HCH transport system substrate-binding protein
MARDDLKRVPRKDRTGANPFTVGAIALIVVVIITYFGFSKHIPFTHGFRLNAVFESATSIRTNSPVRIAGVNVGKVTNVERYKNTNAAEVQMEINDDGLPIHRDATLKIRPRIFLEGNFFIDVQPGTPEAPKLEDNDAPIPVTQTATPVQLDQVLTSLQSNARDDLQTVLQSYGNALQLKPTSQLDPLVQGKTAAEALNINFNYAADALEGVAEVNQALLGTQPGDLSKLIAGLQRTTEGLGRNEEQLKDLITSFNQTTAAFASRSSDLEATIRLLPLTLQRANSAFDALNRAFPPTRAFALELIPGVQQTPATIDAAYPWIAQAEPLLSPSELGGLVNELRPTTADLAKVTDATLALLPKVDLVDRCVTDVVLPTGNMKIADGPFTTGLENYKGFWQTLVGISGEGQNFDGNGQYVRFEPGGGATTFSTGTSNLGSDPLFANTIAAPIGTRPAFPGRRPPYMPNEPCYKQQPPDLNGPAAAVGPPDQTVGTNPGLNPLAPTVPLPPLPSVPGLPGVSLDKKAQQKRSLAGKIADGLNPFRSSSKASKKSYNQPQRSNGPTIEAKDTSGTRTTADANDRSKGTTP